MHPTGPDPQALPRPSEGTCHQGGGSPCGRPLWAWLAICLAALLPIPARASFLAGEALDQAADVLAIIILVIVPLAVVALFWMVHVLPEKLAEKRHHPQQSAIKTLCLLSLVFGGMLWPLAWLWAFVRPVGYKMAYGTDKHEHYFFEAAEQAEKGALPAAELEHIRDELDNLAERKLLTPGLREARARLAALNTPAQSEKVN